jgi:hypothetical protein
MRPIKKDSFFRSRGNVCQLWNIFCANCHEPLFVYQKDGRGSLKRTYLNRIVGPETLASLQDVDLTPRTMQPLRCTKCETLIGVPMMHWEGRLAFRLRPGSWTKTIRKD